MKKRQSVPLQRQSLKPTLDGYFILKRYFPKHSTITVPYPPTELTDEELEKLRSQLDKSLPIFSMMTDLWDWDLHFENDLSDDWYYDAAFGQQSSINALAEQLAEYFLEKVEEYNMDYDSYQDPDAFRLLVMEKARQFIVNWRQNIPKTIAQP